jgi:two-component system response regulator PilR (NtrC family)
MQAPSHECQPARDPRGDGEQRRERHHARAVVDQQRGKQRQGDDPKQAFDPQPLSASRAQRRIFPSCGPASLCMRNLPGAVAGSTGDEDERSSTPMRRPDENSPRRFGASIDRTEIWSPHLARACHDAAQPPRAGAIAVVLQRLREAAGAERAFLLEAATPPGRPRLVAASVSRQDDAVTFSASIAARALRGERPLFFADVRRDPVSADGLSVRALALRSALAAPVPDVGGRRAAVVLDSRAPLALDAEAGCELVRAFAGLISLLRRAGLHDEDPGRAPPDGQVGRSAAFARLQAEVKTAARVPLPALVIGESGSGKELVARSLHDGGRRASRPFVAINCAAIPEALLERELFGATRGAFTGAERDHPGLFRQADGGTVFLDEIGDMPLSLQAKLLRVLQEGAVRAVGALEERPIDVRVVAATHRDLELLVAENRFRADLRWRLEVLVLRVPPLRERADDLPVLSMRLIERVAAKCGVAPARLEAEALQRLSAHDWPGNVRELESVLARALLRAQDGVIRSVDLDIGPARTPADSRSAAGGQGSLESAMIEKALRAARGNVTAAALRIGWSRQALYRRIHALGLRNDGQEPSVAGGTRSSESSTFQ